MNKDTIKLLKECDLGVNMGIISFNDVYKYIKSSTLKEIILKSKKTHLELKKELMILLKECDESGKSPTFFVKCMSFCKTKMRLLMHGNDQGIANLITDGANMGVKSLNKYLNRYVRASDESKEITKRIIQEEEQLLKDLRRFL